MAESSTDSKRIARNTLILNVRLVLTLLIALYSSRLVLKVLGVEDYGLYNVIGGFVVMLSIITNSIIGSSSRFITVALGQGNLNSLNRTFCSIVNVLSLLAALISVIAAVVGPWFISNYLTIPPEKINTALIVYACSVAVFILNILSVPYISLVQAHEHMDFYAIMSIYEAVSKLTIIFFLQYYGEEKLILFAAFLALSSLLSRIFYNIYCRLKFSESNYRFSIDNGIMKNVFSFSVWMGIGSAAGIIKDQAGNILINMFFGLVLNASMGVATQVKGLITQFGNSIGAAISPQITKSYAAGNKERAINLTFLYVKSVGVFMLLVAVPVISETHYILDLWLGIVPDYAISFVQLMICVVFCNVLSMGFGPIFLANGKIRNYQIIAASFVMLYVPVTYLLLKLTGSPVMSLVVSIVMESILIITNYACLKFQIGFPLLMFFRKVILRIMLIALCSFLLTHAMKTVLVSECFIRLVVMSVLSTASVSVLSFYLLFDVCERKKIMDMAIGIIKR